MRRRESGPKTNWWGLLATLLACVIVAYIVVGLTFELRAGWDHQAPLPDPYAGSVYATPVELP